MMTAASNMYRDAVCGPDWKVKHRRRKMFIRATTVRGNVASALPRLRDGWRSRDGHKSRNGNKDARCTYKIMNNKPKHSRMHSCVHDGLPKKQ